MYDALLQYKAKLPVQAVTDSYGLPGSYILCSLHRAENTLNTARLEACIARLCELSEDHHLVMPLHPGTRAALEKAGIFHKIEKVAQILDPVGYLDMLTLQEAATAIITDSGGVQKEAYFLNRPCLIFRNESEWLELLETGRHQLFDVMSEQNCGKILESLITCPNEAEKNIYGNGNAAEKVAAFFAS